MEEWYSKMARMGNIAGLKQWVATQEEYFSSKAFGFRDGPEVSSFKDYLPESGAKILVVGCNDGGRVKMLVEMGYDCYGIDLPSVIEKAKKKYPEIADRLSVCNLECDALPGGPYKLVIAIHVMEHLIGYLFFLPKVARVLDGILFLRTPKSKPYPIEPYHQHHFTREELTQLAIDSGLEVVKFQEDYHITGVFRE